MKKNLSLFTALLLATLGALHAADAPQPKPNIIFILTDDQGYGDVARHGHPLLKTPHMDALYDQSVRFEKFTVSPSCSPSRAALMTGMHEFRNGVTHTIAPREHLNKDALILPQLLKTVGYRTGFIGKWHLGGDGEYAPEKRGFDWCSTNVGGPSAHFDAAMVRNRKREPAKGYREDIFFDDAMKFIEESKQQPFFCYLATYSPHAPLDAPEEFVAPFRGKVDDDEAKFLGMVANIDYNLGRLLKRLTELKLDDNTIIVFMNDNGETHGLDVYNAGMRGSKATIWQGGSRALSFWRWSGTWQPHAVNNLAAHLDVLPTLCDLAGVKIPEETFNKLEGYTLRPLLESTKAQAWQEDRLLFHHVGRWPSGMAAAHKYAMASVQTSQYLLIRSQPCTDPECLKYSSQCTTLRSVEKGATQATYTKANAQFHWGVTPRGQWSLFDLNSDQACQKNLASEKPDLVTKLAAAYDQWWDGVFPDLIKCGGDKGEPDELPKKSAPTKNKK